MTKFFRLVQNEYAKIFHQAKTWVMLALVIAAALGLNAFSLIVKNQQESYDAYYQSNDSQNLEEYYDSQIEYLEREKPEGYKLEIEKNKYLMEQQIPYNDEWRGSAVNQLFNYRAQIDSLKEGGASAQEMQHIQRKADDFEQAVLDNDWKAYCQLQVSLIEEDENKEQKLKEAEQWEYQYRMEHDIPFDSEQWKSRLVQNAAYSYQTLAKGGSEDIEETAKVEEDFKIATYMLEHNIQHNIGNNDITNSSVNFWTVVVSSISMFSLISVFVVVVAGSCVASEFSSGTIKFLLINPVKRGKILMSKYVAIIGYSLLSIVLFYLLNMIFAALFWGVSDMSAMHLYVSKGSVHSISAFLYIAWRYLLGGVDMLVAATLALAISSLMKSSALAIGISISALLAGNGAVLFLKKVFQLDWARYILFANTDLNAIIDGTTPFANQSVLFALGVIVVYMAVFLLIAWDGFVRREV